MSYTPNAFEEAAANLLAVAHSEYQTEIARAVEMIAGAFAVGNKILVFGNGGSAADAEHICAEFLVRFSMQRRALPAIALTTNPAATTACGNDFGFEQIFARQVEAFGRPGDVAWAISTSGNSPNVLAAMQCAREAGLGTIGLTGADGGAIASFCDVLMAVPSRHTPRIQEVHLVTYHTICHLVEERLFGVRNL